MRGIPAGALDRLVAIKQAEDIDNGTATVKGDFIEVGKRWARKRDVSDGEKMKAGENGQALTTRWLMRCDSLSRTINGSNAIMYGGIVYEVVGAKESREYLDAIEITTAARPDSLT